MMIATEVYETSMYCYFYLTINDNNADNLVMSVKDELFDTVLDVSRQAMQEFCTLVLHFLTLLLALCLW